MVYYVRDNFSPIKSILLAIIIGLYNEAFFMVIFTIFFFYILYKFIKEVKLNRNTLYFFVPFILSGTIMTIAPGNFIRTDGMLDGQSVLIYVFHNIFSITTSYFLKA